MDYKKFYQLEKYNQQVRDGKITKNFDYENENHTKQIYYPIKLASIELKIVFVTVPIKCPSCQAKLWDAFFDHPSILKNIQMYVNSPWQTVVCLVCAFSSTRAVPSGKEL